MHGRPSLSEYTDPTIPSSSNNHWIPWLQKQLIVRGITAHTPEVPRAWDPEYSLWRTELERYPVSPDTALIGHSFGAGFLLRWLTENPDVRVASTVLVAPSLGIGTDKADFFSLPLDPLLARRTPRLTVFWSKNDRDPIIEASRTIESAIRGTKMVHLPGHGHFTRSSMGREAFPEILDELTNQTHPDGHKKTRHGSQQKNI